MSCYYTILVIWFILFSIFWRIVVSKPITAFKALCWQFSDLFRISILTPILLLGLSFRIFRKSTRIKCIATLNHLVHSITHHLPEKLSSRKRCYVYSQTEILRGYSSLSDREVEINLYFNLNIEPPTSLTSWVYSPQALVAV